MAEIVETKTDEASGRAYYVYDNQGEKWADNGRWKNPPPASKLTPARGRELAAIARENQVLDKARAFARKEGVDVDNASLEEILAGFFRHREKIHSKADDLFFSATSARGVEGLYPKLITLSDEPMVYVPPQYDEQQQINAAAQLLNILREAVETAKQQPKTIEGKVTNG